MIRDIVKDIEVLQRRSATVKVGNPKIQEIAQDLLSTANANYKGCWGMAAIQIGEAHRVIVVREPKEESVFVAMLNPVIVKKAGVVIESEEGCLSIEGTRKTKRHTKVDLMYTDLKGRTKRVTVTGTYAVIVQHEIDHCNGILI